MNVAFSCNSIEKCCAKLGWSTTLLAALPCRLDISRDNFEGSSYIVSVPRLHCKVQPKIETEHCFFLLLTMQNELIQWNFAKFWRILGLLACAFRLGRTIRDDKEMTYWILRLQRGVWKETGEWWLCRFAVHTIVYTYIYMHYVYMFTRIHKHIDIDMVDIDTGAAIDVDSNKDIRIDIHTSYIFYLSYVYISYIICT